MYDHDSKYEKILKVSFRSSWNILVNTCQHHHLIANGIQGYRKICKKSTSSKKQNFQGLVHQNPEVFENKMSCDGFRVCLWPVIPISQKFQLSKEPPDRPFLRYENSIVKFHHIDRCIEIRLFVSIILYR